MRQEQIAKKIVKYPLPSFIDANNIHSINGEGTSMHIGRSTRIAMAQRGMRSKDLAKTLGMTQSSISLVLARESSPGGLVKKLAEVFGMKASEFVALGED